MLCTLFLSGKAVLFLSLQTHIILVEDPENYLVRGGGGGESVVKFIFH